MFRIEWTKYSKTSNGPEKRSWGESAQNYTREIQVGMPYWDQGMLSNYGGQKYWFMVADIATEVVAMYWVFKVSSLRGWS